MLTLSNVLLCTRKIRSKAYAKAHLLAGPVIQDAIKHRAHKLENQGQTEQTANSAAFEVRRLLTHKLRHLRVLSAEFTQYVTDRAALRDSHTASRLQHAYQSQLRSQ